MSERDQGRERRCLRQQRDKEVCRRQLKTEEGGGWRHERGGERRKELAQALTTEEDHFGLGLVTVTLEEVLQNAKELVLL